MLSRSYPISTEHKSMAAGPSKESLQAPNGGAPLTFMT